MRRRTMHPIVRPYDAISAAVDKASTVLNAASLARLRSDRSDVNPTLSRTEFTGTR
jgi:hypothetical protein